MNNSYKIKWINNKYVYEHRYIIEKHIGRKLHRKENVHHINGNKKDNRIENLEIIDIREHTSIHSKIKIHNGIYPPIKKKFPISECKNCKIKNTRYIKSLCNKCYMHQRSSNIRGRELLLETIKCCLCSKLFKQSREHQIYCSKKCRKISNSKRYWTSERLNAYNLKRRTEKIKA